MRKFLLKKVFPFFIIVLVSAVPLYFFRENILRGIGNFLIHEDPLEKADAVFVLGGDSYDRGNRAIEIFQNGYADKIVCLGENIPTIFKAVGLSYAESEATRLHLLSPVYCFNIPDSLTHIPEPKFALPDSSVIVLKKGTSTREEISAITGYCRAMNFNKIILVTSRFHTRRVKMVSSKEFRKENIQLILSGSKSSFYSENEWWKSEEGLIMVNNEYVKLIYYFFKY